MPSLSGDGTRHDTQDVADAVVESLTAHSPAFHGFYNLTHDFLLARHHQRRAGVEQVGSRPAHGPVGEHEAVKAPLVAQQSAHKVAVGLRELSRNFVVRPHHCPRTGVFHTHLESLEIYLPQSTSAHAGVVVFFSGLLVVGHEMFKARAYAFVLYAFDYFRREDTRQIRVLRIILEIAAAQRVAHYVDAGSKQHVHAIAARFLAHKLAL